MKRDWKKELNDKMYEEWHIDGEDEVDVETFIESLLSEQEAEWKQNMRAIKKKFETKLSESDIPIRNPTAYELGWWDSRKNSQKEHKKQMREAIEEAYDEGQKSGYADEGYDYEYKAVEQILKEFNCEKEKK